MCRLKRSHILKVLTKTRRKRSKIRARDHLDRENEKLDAQRKEMGVADDLAALDGITPAMLVRFGENDIKSLEDFAGCVTDDLTGWFETVERRRVRQEGISGWL